jgi:hypothetical protein
VRRTRKPTLDDSRRKSRRFAAGVGTPVTTTRKRSQPVRSIFDVT